MIGTVGTAHDIIPPLTIFDCGFFQEGFHFSFEILLHSPFLVAPLVGFLNTFGLREFLVVAMNNIYVMSLVVYHFDK